MLKYKNIGKSASTFYGVTIKPGQIKEVPGYINNRNFVRVADTKKKPKHTTTKRSNKPTVSKNLITDTVKPEVKEDVKIDVETQKDEVKDTNKLETVDIKPDKDKE